MGWFMRALITAHLGPLVFFLVSSAFTATPIYAQVGTPQEAYFTFSSPPGPETFVIKLKDSQKIQQAREILATGSTKIVIGTIIKQPVYYNPPWSYHLDPKSISFADFAAEVCDAHMRYLEENLDSAYPGWCPWGSRLLSEIPPPPKPGSENLKPAISMTFPHTDNSYGNTSPANVSLVANAEDPDGAITKIEFNSSGSVIGETGTYPYTFTWQNLAAGTYTVSATATDDQGAKTISKSVTFVISAGSPQLLIDESGRSAALSSVTLLKEPLSVVSEFSFSSDQRTRLLLFGVNLELRPGENLSTISAQAEDSQQRSYELPVEDLSGVPKFPWLTQVTVKLPDELQGLGDVWLSVSLRGTRSNKVLIKIR